ncbi:MAG: plasmid pRiA4b ORF-3 family protein [Thermodesulfobacteriota bacterium]|nr:plasmid pRiA4b ORF-3 family protein [Thermodesulfobacteriota bacterium]
MRKMSFERLEVSSVHSQVLKKTVISDSGPGTILKDFDTLLNYLRKQELPVAGTHQLPRNVVAEMNARLTHPIQLRLKRPQQKSYPHLHGLYLLMRASGLACVGGTGKLFLSVDKGTHQVWENLNPTERYCTLLESWLLRGKPEIIGEGRRGLLLIPDNFQAWSNFFGQMSNKGLQVAGTRDAEYLLRYMPGWHNLGLLELFGLIAIQPGSPIEGKGGQIEHIDRTAFGSALLALLYAKFFRNINLILKLEEEGKVPVGALQPVLQPYFPDWKNNLSIPEWAFREGTHIFKVSLGRLWFRIAIPANYSLESLSSAILNAVEFDYDHLYHFSYENSFGALEMINHPYIDEGPWASDVMVGDVPLRVGQRMNYLYDFGDNWEFDITLEGVDPDKAVKKPVLLEMHGKPPEQYPNWDD